MLFGRQKLITALWFAAVVSSGSVLPRSGRVDDNNGREDQPAPVVPLIKRQPTPPSEPEQVTYVELNTEGLIDPFPSGFHPLAPEDELTESELRTLRFVVPQTLNEMNFFEATEAVRGGGDLAALGFPHATRDLSLLMQAEPINPPPNGNNGRLSFIQNTPSGALDSNLVLGVESQVDDGAFWGQFVIRRDSSQQHYLLSWGVGTWDPDAKPAPIAGAPPPSGNAAASQAGAKQGDDPRSVLATTASRFPKAAWPDLGDLDSVCSRLKCGAFSAFFAAIS